MTLPLRSIALDAADCEGFPFSIPALRQLGSLDFTTPVTFLVGENGSGKSTLLEAMACAFELPTAPFRPRSELAKVVREV